jgi:hypothetical protein
MPEGEDPTGSSAADVPADPKFADPKLHVDITLPDGSKLEEAHNPSDAPAGPVESSLKDRTGTFDTWNSESDETRLQKSASDEDAVYGETQAKADLEKSKKANAEIQAKENYQRNLRQALTEPRWKLGAGAVATALAVGLIFGVPNWSTGAGDEGSPRENGGIVTDVDRPLSDAKDTDTQSTDDDNADDGLTGIVPAGPPESLAPGTGWQRSTTDPLGDWGNLLDSDEIISTRTDDGINAGEAKAAVDLTSLGASISDGNTVELTLGFAGNALEVREHERATVVGWFFISTTDGERLEVKFADDGSVKLLSPPPGASVTAEWSEDTVTVTLTGMEIGIVEIEATVELDIFQGTEQDTVTVDNEA